MKRKRAAVGKPTIQHGASPIAECRGEALWAARLTPEGRGAVATIAIGGQGALACFESEFRPKGPRSPCGCAVGDVIFGHWGPPPGEEVVVARVAADEWELHCHGGPVVVEMVLETLARHGCRMVSWSGYLDRRSVSSLRRAALGQLPAALTVRTAAILLDQARGALERALSEIVERLTAGQEIDAVCRTLGTLCARAEVGRRCTRPWQVVVAGKPNVGKSSLINALVGYQRSIVYDRPGTTRDVVRSTTALNGWPVELCDTAGLRETDDRIEAEGVAQVERLVAEADLVVMLFDATQPWTEDDARRLATIGRPSVAVLNKCDLPVVDEGSRPAMLKLSATEGIGLQELSAKIVGHLVGEPPPRGAAVPVTPEQVEAIETARKHLEAGRVAEARHALETLLR